MVKLVLNSRPGNYRRKGQRMRRRGMEFNVVNILLGLPWEHMELRDSRVQLESIAQDYFIHLLDHRKKKKKKTTVITTFQR